MQYAVLVALALLATYIATAYFVYHRAFVPVRPADVEDLTFTPFEFQADYEDVELVTADGVNFGAWYFRQPGSPQTVIVSGGHKGQRPRPDHLRHQGGAGAAGGDRLRAQTHTAGAHRFARVLDGRGRLVARRRRRAWRRGAGARQSLQRPAHLAHRERAHASAAAGHAVRLARRADAARAQRQQACRLQPDFGSELARAATAVLHPRRRGPHHQREPQPPPVRRVPRAARDLDRAGRASCRRVLRGPAAVRRAGRRLFRAP